MTFVVAMSSQAGATVVATAMTVECEGDAQRVEINVSNPTPETYTVTHVTVGDDQNTFTYDADTAVVVQPGTTWPLYSTLVPAQYDGTVYVEITTSWPLSHPEGKVPIDGASLHVTPSACVPVPPVTVVTTPGTTPTTVVTAAPTSPTTAPVALVSNDTTPVTAQDVSPLQVEAPVPTVAAPVENPTVVSTDTLAMTGSSTSVLALIGLLTVAAGVALMRLGRGDRLH